MSRIVKKVGVLLGIFVLAVAVYFIWNLNNKKAEDITVYTSMEEATLPVVYPQMYGKDINLLHGYKQEMKQTVARESLTILPEDRQLSMRVEEYGQEVTGIRYEVRSLDMSRLVERTDVTDWERGEKDLRAVFPIQNLLIKEQEYLLVTILDTPGGSVNYYTRILWTDNANAEAMINFAVDFTTRTFDYEQARELVTYLETNNTEDNSSLGLVTIRSSFSQLTWGELKVNPVGPIRVTLKELDGIMANIQLDYLVTRETENGDQEAYEATDNFTVKWNEKRIYLMDYIRHTDQIFSGRRDLFSGKRIMVGITNDDEVRVKKSPDGKQLAFLANRDLWAYRQDKDEKAGKEAVKIFSFRSGTDDGLRSNYDRHGIKVLNVADEGNMDFLVYGYMNRGTHEGMMGIALNQYIFEEDAIQEKFFIPISASFEEIERQINVLSYEGQSGMLYLMVGSAVYGIDLMSNEYLVIADGLEEGSYAVSQNQDRFAWQEGVGLYESRLIHVLNLNTGEKQEIRANDGEILRTLGFVGNDLIYGMAREGEQWIRNNRVIDFPMYALEIIAFDHTVQKKYENEESYVADVTVENSRVHLKKMVSTGENSYAVSQDDTIVCNQEVGTDPLAGVGWYASDKLGKMYFIQVDEEIRNAENIKVTTPKKVGYETTEILNLKANREAEGIVFYAYGQGRLLGTNSSFSGAVAMAYDKMGLVTDQNQEIVWNRVNRAAAKNIKSPATVAAPMLRHLEEFTGNNLFEDGVLMMDARDAALNQMLYFVDRGCPVLGYLENGQYVLISGYDQYNITIYDPVSQSSYKMGINDGNEYFKNQGNDFICAVFMN